MAHRPTKIAIIEESRMTETKEWKIWSFAKSRYLGIFMNLPTIYAIDAIKILRRIAARIIGVDSDRSSLFIVHSENKRDNIRSIEKNSLITDYLLSPS